MPLSRRGKLFNKQHSLISSSSWAILLMIYIVTIIMISGVSAFRLRLIIVGINMVFWTIWLTYSEMDSAIAQRIWSNVLFVFTLLRDINVHSVQMPSSISYIKGRGRTKIKLARVQLQSDTVVYSLFSFSANLESNSIAFSFNIIFLYSLQSDARFPMATIAL